jgi:hypothetical protein
MNAAGIAAVLNAIARLGIAWQEYGALIDRARSEGREVSAEDVTDLGRRARIGLDKLNALIGQAEQPEAEEPEMEELETDDEGDTE